MIEFQAPGNVKADNMTHCYTLDIIEAIEDVGYSYGSYINKHTSDEEKKELRDKYKNILKCSNEYFDKCNKKIAEVQKDIDRGYYDENDDMDEQET